MNIDYQGASRFLEQFPLSRLQRLRILAFANTLAAGKEEVEKDGLQSPVRRYAGSSRLSEYFRNYQTFVALLDGCMDQDGRRLVWMHKDCTDHNPRIFEIDRSFVRRPHAVQVPKDDKAQFEAVWRKRIKAGRKCSSDLPVRIPITYHDYYRRLHDHRTDKAIANNEPFSDDLFQDELEKTWATIEAVNASGDIEPQREYRGRCYSNIVQLPKFIDGLVTIDGKATGCIDQHATYFTFLPVILGRYKVQEGAYYEEVAKLRRFIVEAVEGPYKSIYGAIAAGCARPTTVQKIKSEAVAFICDPDIETAKFSNISTWFCVHFPMCWQVLNRLRGCNRVSGDMMELEASIFLEASRMLKGEGIHCVTKHDALIFPVDYAERAEAVLREHFTRAGVVFTGKKTMLAIMESDDTFVPIRTTFCTDKRPKMAENADFVHYCMVPPGSLPPLSVAKNATLEGLSVQSRSRVATMTTLIDGRYRVSWKNRKYNSKKGESEGDFRLRLASLGIFPA